MDMMASTNELSDLVQHTHDAVVEAQERHRVCSTAISTIGDAVLARLAPQVGKMYVRIGFAMLPVQVVRIQVHTIITQLNKCQYKLAPELQPSPIALLAAINKEMVYVSYLHDDDKVTFPPFHIIQGVTRSWYGVCLGTENNVDFAALQRLLSVIDFSNSYFQLVSLSLITPLVHPYDKWASVWSKLESGEPVTGYQRITEMTL